MIEMFDLKVYCSTKMIILKLKSAKLFIITSYAMIDFLIDFGVEIIINTFSAVLFHREACLITLV